VIILMGGCKFHTSGQKNEIVAKVGNKVLLRSDLGMNLPSGISRPDSVARATDFIQRWIRQELMLRMAEKNLTSDQKDFQHELEEYRTSLIIHKYQQQLLSQKLDTVLTDRDIRQFYDTHPERFILDQNIVKAIFIEIPKVVCKPDQIKKWLLASDDKSKTDLEAYGFQFATEFDYFNNQWVDFSRIRARMPFRYDEQERLFKRDRLIEEKDSEKYYFVSIKDFRLVGDKAPFDYVKDRIENLILNNRKMEFIQDLEKNIYQKGKEENLFKIMNR
jgi:hypothetical protein